MPDHVLDPDSIAALNSVAPDDGGAFLRELLDIFLADTPNRLAEISRSLEAGDFPTLTRAAHSIKGSAGNFGARALVEAAWRLEMAARSKNRALAQDLVAPLEQEFGKVRSAMEALRGP